VTTTEVSKVYMGRIRLLESIQKANRCPKYSKIAKSLFWVYMQKVEDVTPRKERKTLSKYNRNFMLSRDYF
jgi:hypothetical protein